MDQKIKKIILVSGVIVGICAIGVGIYFGLQGAKQATIPTQSSGSGSFPVLPDGTSNGLGATSGSNGQLNQLESAAAAASQTQKNNLFQLTTNPAVGFWVASSSVSSTSGIIHGLVYYLNAKGDVVQIQDIGKEQVVAGSSFGVPLKLWQNVDGSRIVALFDSGFYALFNVSTKAWQLLPDGITSVAFSPDGKQLAMIEESNGQSMITAINLTTAKQTVTKIVSFAAVDMALAWPSLSRIFIISHPSANIDGQAWYFDLQKKTLNFFAHGNGLQLVFQEGKPYYALQFVSERTRDKIDVTLVDTSGSVVQQLNFSTLADKCFFDSRSVGVFCGVPRENNKADGLLNVPDDFLKQSVYFYDGLYKINFSPSIMFSPLVNASDIKLDVVSLWATPTQLFFLNRLDQTVYLYNL